MPTNSNPIVVEQNNTPNTASSSASPGTWQPTIGPETVDFLNHISLPEPARDAIRDSAIEILSKSVNPNQSSGHETGLVVGYVQSGKTLSFETVAALARDNAFQIVIVVAGISRPLLGQSTDRLNRDLGLNDSSRGRRWIRLINPEANDPTVQTIQDVLEGWRDEETPPEYKKTVLITVLKHHQRLHNLTTLLSGADLRGVPVLIIDDEADQASLNTGAAQGEESTTYSRLMELRRALPNHTYLQYTATPQAPLLINIIDALSPNFVQVLEPGEDYIGGRHFFRENTECVRVIPTEEVPIPSNPLSEPPDTLLEALRVFMVGVTAGLAQSGDRGNRSMLVHPSHRTAQHQEFYSWVRDIFNEWRRILELPNDDLDKQELIEEFRDAYDDLAETVDDLPDFETLIPRFKIAFRETRVLEVNARGGSTPAPDWTSAYGWILVGGQAMDRGFTVEGLTVTYMPRGIGGGNADTVQQRARFFGYKRRYLGYCRVYLEQATIDAFRHYVDHEEDIRSQLQSFQNAQQPLNAWKRAFILDGRLRPCRDSVLEFDYIRGRFSNSWVAPRVIFASEEILEENRRVVSSFVSQLEFADNPGHQDRTPIQRHAICENVPLRHAIEELLVPIRIAGVTDSQRHTALLLQLSKTIENNPNETCTVYRMSPSVRRDRSVDEEGIVANLFQGEFPVERSQRGSIYPGDRALREEDSVTIQIHDLRLTRDDRPVADNVSVITVWVPSRLAMSWVSQNQPPQS